MPDTTPNYGWRIPKADGSDFIIPDDVRLPITSIDAQMKIEENARIAVNNSVNSKDTAMDARVDWFDTNDPVITTTIANVITAVAGWTINTVEAYKIGRIAFINWIVVRTGASFGPSSDGNLTNTGIGNIKAGWAPLNRTGFTGGGVGGYIWAGYADPLSTGGALVIGAAMPNNPVATNDSLYASTVWVWK